ncbi:MAG: sugar phosphate nucleotidyltransferase [Acidobacteria bacterium]|nr:sugar phosphate nucleotidyltransferase [Acidobacteriota bacterium]
MREKVTATIDKAVILAAGSGSRMRRAGGGAELTAEQRRAADAGLKGLMPFGRRRFLDFVIEALANSGIQRVCLVVGPRSEALDRYVVDRSGCAAALFRVVQVKPLGTADAVLCARSFTGDDCFLVLSSDNYYPPEALTCLGDLDGPGLLAVERMAVARDPATNLTEERLAAFAMLELDDEGCLRGIFEKPTIERYRQRPDPLWLSVNCWRFGPSIHGHCAAVEPSRRGELELPTAARAAIEAGERIRVVPTTSVLDLSSRGDVALVGRLLGEGGLRG